MKTLELFSGSQSFTQGIKRLNSDAECITIDICNAFNPSILTSILDWDYTIYPSGYFDMIWASPPCTHYSIAKTRGVRDLEGSDQLVSKAIEIIEYFKPSAWIIENVGTGLLVNRMESIKKGLNMYFTDYCCYGKPARKRTVFWSNKSLDLQLCPGIGLCKQIIEGRHRYSLGNSKRDLKPSKTMQYERFIARNSIPKDLIDQIILQLLV